MRVGKSNLNEFEGCGDVVDSLPYNSEWASGLNGCELGDVSTRLSVGASGVNAQGGFDWSTLIWIGGGLWLVSKLFKK